MGDSVRDSESPGHAGKGLRTTEIIWPRIEALFSCQPGLFVNEWRLD